MHGAGRWGRLIPGAGPPESAYRNGTAIACAVHVTTDGATPLYGGLMGWQVTPTTGSMIVEGRRVTWEEAGVGPPIVLVHGLAASGSWWRSTLPVLTPEFRVLFVDLAGFGACRRQPVRLDRAADTLAAWLRALGLERVTLVGHSRGGYVVADVAVRHPDLVDRLVLVNAAGLPLPQRALPHFVNLVRSSGRAPLQLIPRAMYDTLRAGPIAIARAAHQILAADIEPHLARITVPTLVVWGDRDPLIPLGMGRRLAAALPMARLVVLTGAGHAPMWERQDAFNDTLLTFLRHGPDQRGGTPATTSLARDPGRANRPTRDVLAPTSGRMARRYLGVGPWWIHARVAIPRRPASDVPIVLVHGFVISGRYFVPLLKRLGRRHRVFAPDLPGFGWSSRPRRPLDVPELADALALILERAGIRRAVVVGNSLGSQVAAELANRHAHLVERLVLTGPTFDPAERSLARQFLRLVSDIHREKPTLWFLHLPDYALAGLGRAWRTLHLVWRHRIERVLPRIGAPTLVVRGEHDSLVPERWAREAAALLPRGRLVQVPGAGHAVNHGAPGDVAVAIEAFLDAPVQTDRGPTPTGAAARPSSRRARQRGAPALAR